MSTAYLLTAIAVAALITVTLRALPFTIRERIGESPLMADLARWMPLGIVLILAAHAVAGLDLGGPGPMAQAVAGVGVTIGAHLWRRNLLLSVCAGTLVYVGLGAFV